MILNFYVDDVDIYCLINEYGVKIIRDDKNNIPVIHLTPLRLVKKMKKSAERIGNNLYEITEKTKRKS